MRRWGCLVLAACGGDGAVGEVEGERWVPAHVWVERLPGAFRDGDDLVRVNLTSSGAGCAVRRRYLRAASAARSAADVQAAWRRLLPASGWWLTVAVRDDGRGEVEVEPLDLDEGAWSWEGPSAGLAAVVWGAAEGAPFALDPSSLGRSWRGSEGEVAYETLGDGGVRVRFEADALVGSGGDAGFLDGEVEAWPCASARRVPGWTPRAAGSDTGVWP